MPGTDAVFTDYPFDNDNWVDVIARRWPTTENLSAVSGYELASAYNEQTKSGFVTGSVVHDFWKTGVLYVPVHIPVALIRW